MIEEVFEYNQFFVAVMNIINFSRLCPPKEGHRHHIIPKCWFKLHNIPIDNSEDNLDTNGKINKFCYECPDGFQPGMAYRKRGK